MVVAGGLGGAGGGRRMWAAGVVVKEAGREAVEGLLGCAR